MSWHFGGPVPAEMDYRGVAWVEQLLAWPQGGTLLLGISRLGKTSLLYRISERLTGSKEGVIQVSSAERALPRIEKASGLLLLDEAQQLREWKVQDLRRLRRLLEERPFIMAAHPSLLREERKAELHELLRDTRKQRLRPLDREEAQGLIRRLRSQAPESCEPLDVEAIFQATGGFPNLIAGLCLHLTDDGMRPLRAPGEADLRAFVHTDLGVDAFRDLYNSLPPPMQEVLDACRDGERKNLEMLQEHFLVSGTPPEFSGSLFGRVWGPEGNWRTRSARRASGSGGGARPLEPEARPVDFCIITALEEEKGAVLSKLPEARQLDRDGTGPHTYFEAQVKTRRTDGAVYRVIVTCLSGMGPTKGAIKASAVSTRWNPRHVLVVGIGGGLLEEVAPGDVMVASDVADYTLGKQRDRKPREIRPKAYPADENLFDAANNFATGWQELVGEGRPEAGEPKRKTGIIASGGDVIASKEVVKALRAQIPKLIGVEMEGGGVAAALHEDMNRPRFLMIRGVSDLADGDLNTEVKARWRGYACHVAAAYAVGLLRSGPVERAALGV